MGVIHGIACIHNRRAQKLLRLRRVASMLYIICSSRWASKSLGDKPLVLLVAGLQP
jgi:hypothetical protein